MSKQGRSNPVLPVGHCAEYEQLTRRAFLGSGLRSLAALALGETLVAYPAWMPRVAFAPPHVGPRGDTLVCIFLRGGADGLNMVIPHGDEGYYEHRSVLSIAPPDATQAEYRVLDLDGFFGLHPSLAPLQEIYAAGDLAPIHATGAPDESRSHFEAMALMERGASTSDYNGWLGRHLATLDTGNDSALRAIAIGDMLPASLTGAVSATALQSIAEHHLQAREEREGAIQSLLAALYEQGEDILAIAARQTLASIETLSQIGTENRPPRGRDYPEGDFGTAMRTVARLIDADVGVEVACVDLGGWDTHAAQGSGQGQMANLMDQLAQGLAAFYEDLQPLMDSLTVVVMSEFGRRVQENGALGTDHGHGNMMLVMGGGIRGGQVYARWPGLQPEQLVGPGDLAITTDYRDVLGEIIRKRLNNPQVDAVFPGYTVSEIGLAVERE
ncbi:MAG TPA: DUF1501 domain-containing protein [Chloroflexi bacterium]|nr:DUF1501 domain-containing protein [Chloroflexota bacterium]